MKYDKKLKMLSLKSGKQKETTRNRKGRKAEHEIIYLLLHQYGLKLQATLDSSMEAFTLDVNAVPFFDYPRYIAADVGLEGDDFRMRDSNKIRAKAFLLNNLPIMDSQTSKSLQSIDLTLDHIHKVLHQRSHSLEMLDLACDDEHFVGLFEVFYEKIYIFSKIRVLSLVKLPQDLLITDLNLM